MNDYFNQESERLIYRKVSEADIEPWSHFFIDNPSLRFLGVPFEGTPLETAAWWMENQYKRYEEKGIGHLATYLKSTNELVGMVGILPREFDGVPTFEIGYSVMPKFWRQGYASEMSQQLKKFGKANRNDGKYISIIHPENEGSMKVARANGMAPVREQEHMGMPVIIFEEE